MTTMPDRIRSMITRTVRCSTVCAVLTSFCLLPAGIASGDVGDAMNLEVAARWGHGPTYATHAAPDLLLVGEGSVLRVLDNQIPTAPADLGEVLLTGVIMDIARSGPLVYVAANRGDLRVVDLANPSAPLEVGALSLPGHPYSVDVVDGRVYVASEDGGLRVVDVSDPTSPFELGSYAVDLYAMDVFVAGTTAYVADMYDSALEVYDVSDPGNIQLLASESTPGPPWAVEVDGTRAVVVDDYAGISVFDVSTPGAPVELGSSWLDDVAYDVVISGDHALVAEDWKGLVIIDFSGLPAMVRVDDVDTPGYAFGASLLDDLVYVSDSQEGVRIVDVSTIGNASEVGYLAGTGSIRRVLTLGTVSYALDEFHGLRILQPAHGGGAIELGAVEMPGSPNQISVAAGVAWVAAGSAGDVRIADVSDPRNPSEIGWIDLPEYALGSGATSVSADAGRLAVVDRYYGIYFFDVSDPASPLFLGDVGTGTYPRDVLLHGRYAYMAERDGGIRVFDVDAPGAPAQIASFPFEGYNFALERDGDLLFVAKDWRGVWIVDVSDPGNPQHLRMLDTPGGAVDLSVAYPYLYVADGTRVRAYDYSNIWDISEVASYDCDDHTQGVSAYRGTVHVAGMAGGWYELENSLVPVGRNGATGNVERIRLDNAAPNPFNPRTRLHFAIAREGHVRLDILDAAGRRVRVLVDEWLPAGAYDREWDGRDGSGRPVASGVYRYRLEADGRSQTRGMTLIR